jgi:L,D-peptidoglycan transpeptidase YkuD (ErfK/YbiS/YcfS/YnhG family)
MRKNILYKTLSYLLFLMLGFSFNITAKVHAMCTLQFHNHSYPCSLGKNGIRADKKEGDGATPVGSFPIRKIFYRSDKLSSQDISIIKKMEERGFLVQALSPKDGWVDDPTSIYYNQYINTSHADLPSHEDLWREDTIYDIIVVLGYNDKPILAGKGSAIFMHIARPNPSGGFGPTLGCIALAKQDLISILNDLQVGDHVQVSETGEIRLD